MNQTCFSDCNIKIVPISSVTEYRNLEGHNAPILSVAIDPKEEFLVSFFVVDFSFDKKI